MLRKKVISLICLCLDIIMLIFCDLFEFVYRLWSQLANETEKLVFDKTFVSIVDLKELYDNFIREFEHRINVLQLIRIVLPVANHLFDKSMGLTVTKNSNVKANSF